MAATSDTAADDATVVMQVWCGRCGADLGQMPRGSTADAECADCKTWRTHAEPVADANGGGV